MTEVEYPQTLDTTCWNLLGGEVFRDIYSAKYEVFKQSAGKIPPFGATASTKRRSANVLIASKYAIENLVKNPHTNIHLNSKEGVLRVFGLTLVECEENKGIAVIGYSQKFDRELGNGR